MIATLSGDSGSFLKLTSDPDGAPRAPASLNLTPGRYDADVTDNRGSARSAIFEAVDESRTSMKRNSQPIPRTSAGHARVWIAQANAGYRRLEAFQRLFEAASNT